MNPDSGLRQQGCLEVLEGFKSQVEHVSESIYVYHRGRGSSVGLYISTHQLFFLICQLLFCLLTDSIGSCMWDGERHLSKLYMGPEQLHKQPHNRWRMLGNVACVYQISYFEI